MTLAMFTLGINLDDHSGEFAVTTHPGELLWRSLWRFPLAIHPDDLLWRRHADIHGRDIVKGVVLLLSRFRKEMNGPLGIRLCPVGVEEVEGHLCAHHIPQPITR